MNSRDKGKRGELLLARFLREHGYEARRTAQYCGSTGDAADVVGLPGLHIECKFVERLDVRKALRQAVRDALAGRVPVVFHKRSREEWLVTLRAVDFMKIYPEWEAADPEGRETALRRTTMKDNKAPRTRADRIRAMSDGELARLLCNADWCEACDQVRQDGTCHAMELGGPLNEYCVAGALNWLRQPAP